MCGICGTFAYGATTGIDAELVQSMLHAIAHRGPDGEGLYSDGSVCLGHRRLSIIDVAGGAQPLANEDESVWISFNGEIYNFRELRLGLESKGHRFKTRSDTEVVVHLYEDLGEAALQHLNGIFALAIWDTSKQRLLLARDPFGVKPLYYVDLGGRLTFASELRALLAVPELSREVDPTALDWFLTYRYVPSPRTMLRSVRKVPPGQVLLADRAGIHVRRYTPTCSEPICDLSEPEAVNLIREGFGAAVGRQMVSDVPIGAL